MKKSSLEILLRRKCVRGQKLFCAFLTLGYKSLKQTEELICLMDRLGVDVVELGIPFSDPLADGAVIQEASEYALAKGIRPQDAFELVARLRKQGVNMPIVFFSYFNPILQRGVRRFVADLKQSGFDGVICPDLPPEEDQALGKELSRAGLSQIHLIAPTTTRERVKKIVRKSHGFVYYVSRRGVTGVQEKLDLEISGKVSQIKRETSLPVLVGFGVSSEDQVKRITQAADGVIVGSALIQEIKRHGSNRVRLEHFLKRLVASCHGASK